MGRLKKEDAQLQQERYAVATGEPLRGRRQSHKPLELAVKHKDEAEFEVSSFHFINVIIELGIFVCEQQ